MARKLSPEEQARTRADFDTPEISQDETKPEKKTRKREILRGNHRSFKLSDAEIEQLSFSARVFNVKQTRIISWGIGKVYAEAVAQAKKPKEAQPMNEDTMRARLKEAGYSLRKKRGGTGYIITKGDITDVAGGSGYTFTLEDVAEFVERHCK